MLPRELDGRRVLRALARLGWHVVRVRGSHHVLRHVSGRGMVLAFHGSLGRNSCLRALRQAGLAEEEFEAAF
jgi:predicted RNA binding protein YcfA (HicA-like mRNA interferase family)